jgi:hypothetical protein
VNKTDEHELVQQSTLSSGVLAGFTSKVGLEPDVSLANLSKGELLTKPRVSKQLTLGELV